MSPREFLNGRVVLHPGDCMEILPTLEAGSVDAVTDLAVGIAAEHLVCADLLLGGWRAFLADQNCPYDVAVECRGRLIRVQVKCTRNTKPVPGRPGATHRYMWHLRRAGKGGRRTYGEKEFDVLALVALDIRSIAYVAATSGMLQTIHLRPPGSEKNHGNCYNDNVDEYPFISAAQTILGAEL